MEELSRDEQLRQEAFTRKINEVAYGLDRAGLIEEGRAEGLQEGTIKIALNMLKEETKISFICKVTGLSEEEIKALKKTVDL